MSEEKASTPVPEKRPVGRPTSYKPEYCEALIKHMSDGYSFESFGATIGVARDAVFEWAKKYPEFSDAKALALDLNLMWWERQGHKGLWVDKEGPALNNTVYVFSMKNRHGWSDRKDINVKAEAINPETKKLTTEELVQLANRAVKITE